jgi:type VI secretion system protein ImpL
MANGRVPPVAREELEVASRCPAFITGKYPFVRGSTTDLPLADFGLLFGANGIMDRFFKENLERYVDTIRPQQWT